MRAVVRPGKFEPRAAIANNKPSRIRSCAGIADDGLVEIAYLHGHTAFLVADRAEIADITRRKSIGRGR